MNDPILIVSVVSALSAIAAWGRSIWHRYRFDWHSDRLQEPLRFGIDHLPILPHRKHKRGR